MCRLWRCTTLLLLLLILIIIVIILIIIIHCVQSVAVHNWPQCSDALTVWKRRA
jgi:hypothetical protein